MSSERASRSGGVVAEDRSHLCDSREIDADWRAVRATLDQIGGKWQLPIIEALLRDGPLRFSELEAQLDPIASATLSNSLEDFQAEGFVERRVLNTKPVRVEYALTERGQSFESVLDSLVAWGEANICTIKLIKNKHHPAIIYLLLVSGPHYFNELKETLDITNKVLSESLERLQEYGIVQRTVEDSKPVRVEYSLTDRGESIVPVFESLSGWGQGDSATGHE